MAFLHDFSLEFFFRLTPLTIRPQKRDKQETAGALFDLFGILDSKYAKRAIIDSPELTYQTILKILNCIGAVFFCKMISHTFS